MNGGMFTVKLLNKFIDSRFFFFLHCQLCTAQKSAQIVLDCTVFVLSLICN